MKKSLKISLVILTIGIIMTLVAALLGGRIISFSPNNTTNISESYSGVESIDLDLGFSEVEVKTGNDFKIDANNVPINKFKSYVENGVWHVQNNTSSRIFNINNCQPKVIIYIPESFKSSKLKINIGAGELIADKLNAGDTDINVGAGNLKINNLVTDEIKINCGVGNVEIGGKVNNNGDIKCGVGNIGLNLNGNEKDYNYNLKLGIGEITLNGDNLSGIGSRVIDNTSNDNNFKIDCGIGKVSLNIN